LKQPQNVRLTLDVDLGVINGPKTCLVVDRVGRVVRVDDKPVACPKGAASPPKVDLDPYFTIVFGDVCHLSSIKQSE